MKLVITESQSERLTEQLKDRAREWAGNQFMKGGEKILGSKGGKRAVGAASDIMQKQAMDKLSKGMKFSPEQMKDFDIDFEKDAPTLSKFMSKLQSLRGDAKTKVGSPLLPNPVVEPSHPSPGGATNYKPSKKEKRAASKTSKVKVPKNLSIEELGRYMMHPLGGKVAVTSDFGDRDVTVGSKDHGGVDLRANSGSPVYAPLDGRVVRSEDTTGKEGGACGGHIRIDHGKLQTKFCHLSNMVVAKGSNVKRGQIIGYSGGGENDPYRGVSTAAHLHYEILDVNNKALDPLLIEPNLV